MTMIAKIKKTISAIRKRLQLLTTTPIMRIVVVLPPVLILVMTVLILMFLSQLPPQVPFFYSRPWGEEQLVQPIYLLILPISALFWYVISILLIHVQTYQYRVFAQILLIAQAILSIAMVYVLIRIMLLVT